MLLAIEFDNLHQILRSLYTDMMPLCGNMAGVAKGIAGLGALFYVAAKVWQSLASAEPIDVYPLLRPFVIGFCIMFFPTFVLGTINSVMSPVVKGCNNMLETQTFDMNAYREQKDKLEYEAMVRNPETAYLVSDEAFDKQIDELGWSAKDIATMGGMYMDRAAHNIKQSVRDWFRELLELLFQSAALVIDTIRTFFLIVLAILGPIAFAISVYDGFQATLTQWITRYISVYLWLPVSDLFSSILARIQVLMLQKDIQELSDPNFVPDSSNSVYIIFMIIGIIGYFTIPTVSNWIIQAGGMGNMSRNINSAANKTGSGVGAVAGAATGNAGGRVGGKLISKYSINSLVYWVTYVHNVVYSFYRSMIYCYINSTQRCAGSIVIDIIPTNGADKRKFFPFAPYFPVTNVIKRYFYPYFPAIIGIKGYSFPYFPYLSGIMKIKTALYSLFSRLDWHKTVVFPCLGEIYEGIRSLSWEIPVT